MDAIEKLRDRVRIVENYAVGAFKARVIITGLVFFGFVISGIIEHSVTVALTAEKAYDEGNATAGRRYCDPPNMTALAIYYDSSEDARDYDDDDDDDGDGDRDDYDFSQLQEMLFESSLTPEESMEILLTKSYLWGTLVSPVPAAQLARNIGAKRVFGYALLGSAAATLLVPAAWLTPSHVVIRFVQGLLNGALLPSCHTLGVSWFAPTSRSSFVSWYSGKYVGFAMSELLTSAAVESIGRDFIFHIIGLLTMIWFVLWSVLVFSTPDKNGKLSAEAKRKIKLEIGDDVSPNALDVPWKHILCSRPVWMSIGAVFGSRCGQTTTNVGIRQYLKFVYNVSKSLLSAIPFAIHGCLALLCGYAVDWIQRTRFVSVTSSRRMFVYVSHFLPAAFIFVVSFVGCDVTAPIVLYSLSIVASAAVYSGALCSPIDIAPNFAGVIVGLCSAFGAAGDLIIVYVISHVLDGEVLGSWRITFSLTSLVLLLSSILFMLRGSGSVQAWNDPPAMEAARMCNPCQQKAALQSHADSPATVLKIKNKVSVEEKILKVLHVQEPERFTRVRAYSTSLPNESAKINPRIPQILLDKKRASIS